MSTRAISSLLSSIQSRERSTSIACRSVRSPSTQSRANRDFPVHCELPRISGLPCARVVSAESNAKTCRTRARQATAEPSSALCAIGSSGLVTPRTRFQLTLAHNTLVNPTNALYLVFKFAVVLWQSLDHDIRSLRKVQANGACRKQPLADLEFVLIHNSTEV